MNEFFARPTVVRPQKDVFSNPRSVVPITIAVDDLAINGEDFLHMLKQDPHRFSFYKFINKKLPDRSLFYLIILFISSGKGISNFNFSFVIGCIKDTLYACKDCLEINFEGKPYKVSPKIGCPINFECKRI